jgi:translation elongation factor EF-Tu-like GTPase
MVKNKVKVKSKKAKSKKIIKGSKTKVKKNAKKKPAAKKSRSKAKKPQGVEASLEKIGEVTHYFPHVNAAAVKLLKSGLKVGDSIYIKGHTTDFKELVQSIQLDHATIPEGKKGQEIGLLVKSRVRQGDKVYKI